MAALVGLLGFLLYMLQQSPYVTQQKVALEQPVPLSHQHHVSGLGIDCRYCHTSVETSNFAGIPPVSTCMNCHKEIWTNAKMLEPIREAYRSGVAIQWERLHPGFLTTLHQWWLYAHFFAGYGMGLRI